MSDPCTKEHGLFAGAAFVGVAESEDDRRDAHAWVSARSEFMRAVVQVRPEVAQEVRAEFQRFLSSNPDPVTLPDGEGVYNQPFDRAVIAFGNDAAFDAFWKEWSERWNLAEPWCKAEAVALCCDLRRLISMDVWHPERFSFDCAGWHPESPRTSMQGIRDAFEAKLKDHVAKAEDHFRRMGWHDPTENYERAHYIWAARYQVARESEGKIANDLDKSRQAVQKAVTHILERVGLTARPPNPAGRPAASK